MDWDIREYCQVGCTVGDIGFVVGQKRDPCLMNRFARPDRGQRGMPGPVGDVGCVVYIQRVYVLVDWGIREPRCVRYSPGFRAAVDWDG